MSWWGSVAAGSSYVIEVRIAHSAAPGAWKSGCGTNPGADPPVVILARHVVRSETVVQGVWLMPGFEGFLTSGAYLYEPSLCIPSKWNTCHWFLPSLSWPKMLWRMCSLWLMFSRNSPRLFPLGTNMLPRWHMFWSQNSSINLGYQGSCSLTWSRFSSALWFSSSVV